jgi:ABC-2 type transport system permease protein
MAVYRKSYHRYPGRLTSLRSRFLVVARYALRRVLQSRILAALLVAGALYTAGCAIYVYACHNVQLLRLVGLSNAAQADLVGPTFFLYFVSIQTGLAFLLAAFSGPGLIAPDVANQGVVLYLSRPFSRAEYLLGKLSVLAFLLSVITWIPGTALFAIQAGLAGSGWADAHLWILRAILLASIYGILLLSMLALALSAWFKRKLVAGGGMFAIFFLGGGFAQAFNNSLHTRGGDVLDLGKLITIVENGLFRRPSSAGITAETAWIELFVICAVCVIVIVRRIRAREVVLG